MQGNRTAIQFVGLIMSKQTLDMNHILDLVQILNSSSSSCRDVITIFQDIFKHEKSGKILLAVNALQYLVKNCNGNLHNAANRQSFQKRLLSLLNRIRGKTNLIKQLNSNTDNWCRIEAKVLYIIQLWYDAFILQESKFFHIINTYKILRKENVTFPPRSKNQKNLMYVQTQSPIFDNIEQIANQDQRKFTKKLNALGMGHLAYKLQKSNKVFDNTPSIIRPNIKISSIKPSDIKSSDIKKQIDIDQISQKIAIIQSTEYSPQDTLKSIEQIKQAIQFGQVKPNQQAYWKIIKGAAQDLISQWENKNADVIKSQEKKYLENKLGMINKKSQNQNQNQHQLNNENQANNKNHLNNNKKQNRNNQIDIFDAFDEIHNDKQQPINTNNSNPLIDNQEINLLDL